MTEPELAHEDPTVHAAPRALLEAAYRVFGARGYRATRLEEVADAAGVTKGAIYYHFDSKEDLLRRALENRHRAVFTEVARDVADQDAPASAKLRFVLRKVWQRWLEPEWGHAFRLVLGEVSVELPGIFRMWALEGPIRGWSMVRELIDEGIRSGEFRADVDAEVAARLVVSGLLLQAALQVHLGLDELAPCDPDRIFDSSVDLFLHGLLVTHRLPEGG